MTLAHRILLFGRPGSAEGEGVGVAGRSSREGVCRVTRSASPAAEAAGIAGEVGLFSNTVKWAKVAVKQLP